VVCSIAHSDVLGKNLRASVQRRRKESAKLKGYVEAVDLAVKARDRCCIDNLNSELAIDSKGVGTYSELDDSCPSHAVCGWSRSQTACAGHVAGVVSRTAV
jgi:hypothetical protein